MNKIRNLKYIVPFVMSAMVACNPDEPIPEPTPPTPPKPKTENISIKSMDNLRTVRDMKMDQINTYNATWANNFAAAPAEHSVIGEVDALATNRTYFNHDKNGKGVYPTDANSVLTMEQWASGNYTDLVAGPNGEKYHVSHDQVAQFTARGENDIIKVAAPTKMISLTEVDAADFSNAIARIKSANPGERIKIHCPVTAVIRDDNTVYDMSSLRVKNPTATFEIVDKDGNPTDLKFTTMRTFRWDTTIGGTAHWILASEAAGTKPRLVWDRQESGKYAQIISPRRSENTVKLSGIPGVKDYTIIELNNKTLPLNYPIYVEDMPDTKCQYELDAGDTALYITSQVATDLKFKPNTSHPNIAGNATSVLLYLQDEYSIIVTNPFFLTDWDESTDFYAQCVVIYDDELLNRKLVSTGRFDGKSPYRAADVLANPGTRGNGAIATRATTHSAGKYSRMQNTR